MVGWPKRWDESRNEAGKIPGDRTGLDKQNSPTAVSLMKKREDIHIPGNGCGTDSRSVRGDEGRLWSDVRVWTGWAVGERRWWVSRRSTEKGGRWEEVERSTDDDADKEDEVRERSEHETALRAKNRL